MSNIQKTGQIIGRAGNYAGSRIPIANGLVIGRDSSVSQLIIDSTNISRKHCEITYDPVQNLYFVEDFSTNGVYRQDGSRIPSNRKISFQLGEVIKVGNENVSFEFLEPEIEKEKNVKKGNFVGGDISISKKVPSTASLVLGVLSLILATAGVPFFGVIVAIAGLIMGIVGIVLAIKTKKLTGDEKGTGAFVCSLLGIIFGAVFGVTCGFCGACTCGMGTFGCIGGPMFGAAETSAISDMLFDSLY